MSVTAQFDIENGKLPQSCIISGASREESFARARQAAAAAVCSGTGAKPCGVCRDCRKAQNGVHPDIITVSRLTDDKGRLKAQISVDQIREMNADACVLPNEAERKVYIIQDAETMNTSAQNAALKLLEEPPAWTVFILCTVNAQQLLPTVRSRCAEFNLAGKRESAEKETTALAEEYIKTAASGDRAKLLKWCCANEGMDGRAAQDFVVCVRELLTDMLCARRKSFGLDRHELMRLCRLADTCAERLRVNAGVKHIFGLLAVDSIADGGNRGNSN